MSVLALTLAVLLAPTAWAAPKKKPSTQVHKANAAQRLYARVAKEGRRVKGMMLMDAELPTDRMYFEHSDPHGPRVVVAEDGSWCLTAFMIKVVAGAPAAPSRAIDHGCLGSLATTDLDWSGDTPTPMTQSRLDGLYAETYAHAFPQ